MVISCEHAGNEIPEQFQHLFKGKEDELYTHKAIDFGSLELARSIADSMKVPLYYNSISRLLVDLNRSEDNPEIFSSSTNSLAQDEKRKIIEEYYIPHRQQVEEVITAHIQAGKKVYHVAVHTFTPALNGLVREADIGILFDPSRPLEVQLYESVKNILYKIDPALTVKENFPYPGVDDGFPTFLRKKFSKDYYCGVELEVNQKYFLSGDSEKWDTLKASISSAFLVFSHSV